MKCKACHQEIPLQNVIYCPWCGNRTVKSEVVVHVPLPKIDGKGLYVGRVMHNGVRATIKEKTEAKYYQKARAIKDGTIELSPKIPKQALCNIIDKYIESNSNILSPSTIKAYISYRQFRFQDIMLQDISTIDWQKAINSECESVSGKTVCNAWRLITASLKAYGIQIPAVNLPTVATADKPFLDCEQIHQLLFAVQGESCEIAVILALHSLRRSEIYALTAEDIDRDKKTITVHRSAVFAPDGSIVIKEAGKTKSATRTIPIMIDRLLDLTEGATGNLITCHISNLIKQVKSACGRAGLPQVGLHDLRRSFASLCYSKGISERYTMLMGGWSDIQTVHKHYIMLSQSDINSETEKLIEFFND